VLEEAEHDVVERLQQVLRRLCAEVGEAGVEQTLEQLEHQQPDLYRGEGKVGW
jgi:hypothetical protein